MAVCMNYIDHFRETFWECSLTILCTEIQSSWRGVNTVGFHCTNTEAHLKFVIKTKNHKKPLVVMLDTQPIHQIVITCEQTTKWTYTVLFGDKLAI